MAMKDLSTGPDWIVWVVFVILVAISAILLSGHGANLIAGYNTALKEKKNTMKRSLGVSLELVYWL